jgi:chromosome segregation ATPase
MLSEKLDAASTELYDRKTSLSDTQRIVAEKESQISAELETVEFLKEELRRKSNELLAVTDDHSKAMDIIHDYKAMLDEIEQKQNAEKAREKIDEDAYMLEIRNIESAWQDVVRSKEEEIETLKHDLNRLRDTMG